MAETPRRDFEDAVRDALADPSKLVRATLRDGRVRMLVRPVVVRGRRVVQIEGAGSTRNVRAGGLASALDDVLVRSWSSADVRLRCERIQVRRTRRGGAVVSRCDAAAEVPDLAHDRAKRRLVESREFMRAVGLLTPDGRVRAGRRAKHRQVEEFSRIVDASVRERTPLSVADLGCGNAYLTFAVHHLFAEVRGQPCTTTGVDRRADAAARNAGVAASLGWTSSVHFVCADIARYEPDAPPDVVLALHACDTATDDAIARAVRWRSRHLFVSPCCHNHVQAQMTPATAPGGMRAITGHAILHQRFGDLFTDALRALVLRLLGWRADIVQFVDAEHSGRDLLIRATRTGAPPRAADVHAFSELTTSWRVRPYLAQLLASELEGAGVR